jgi:hypothetical protein
MKNVAFAITLVSCIVSVSAVSPSQASSGVPDAVERAAAFNNVSLSGVLVQERHVDFSASAGPVHASEQNDAVVMLQDGQYKHVRYLRIVSNGKTLSADKVAERESQNNTDLDRGKSFFKQPFDSRYLRDYTYEETDCAPCATRERAVAFRSETRDDQHGDGTMIIDASSGRVMTVTYTPNVMPDHASDATVVETFGEAAPGVWTIISIERTYSGHVAFFRGSGKMTEKLDHFQRFVNPYAGMEYLQRASL